MPVLFLALGATRQRTVSDESAQVVADGGRAVVVVERAGAWTRATFAPGVEVVELSRVEGQHPVLRAERALLFRAPRLLLRAVGRGPLAARATRAARAYERRIASAVHRRVVLPAYGRVFGRRRHRLVERHVLAASAFDLLVVADPASMPVAARLVDRVAATGRPAPRVCFDLDHPEDRSLAG